MIQFITLLRKTVHHSSARYSTQIWNECAHELKKEQQPKRPDQKKDCRISEKSVENGRRLHGKHPQNGFSDHEAMLPERR